MPAQLQPTGNAHQINLNAADVQAAPATAALANSGYVAVWENRTDGLLELRVFDALGNPTDYQPSIGAAGVVVSEPDVAALQDGGFVVVYTRETAGNQDVVFQRFNARGQPVGAETPVQGADGAEIENEPSVAALQNGDFAITWTDRSTDATGDIRVAVYSPAGERVHGPVGASVIPGAQAHSDVAALNGGGFVVVYSNSTGGDTDVYFHRFDSNHQEYQLGQVNTTDGGEIQSDATVIGLSGGGFAVAFEHTPLIGNDAIRARIYQAAGTPLEDDFLVSSASANEGAPSIAATWDGFAVAYNFLTPGSGFDVVIEQFLNNGGSIAGPVTAGGDVMEPAGNQQEASLLFTADGRLVVTYADSNGGAGHEIASQTFDGRDGDNIFGDLGDNTLVGREALLQPYAVEYLAGDQGNDLLYGLSGTDVLSGDSGNDTLVGGKGKDTLTGGLGDDLFVLPGGDTIQEAPGEGTDTVRTNTAFSLANIANVENLELVGAGNIGGTGNTLDNRITGNAGNNILRGNEGADTLIGGGGADELRGAGGADVMRGGAGNDIYFIDVAGDQAIESASGAAGGNDTVYSQISRTLGANLEILRLQGSADLNGNGNALNNRLVGNAGANRLQGFDGNDTLEGKDGADTLSGHAGNDTMTGGSQADVFRFTTSEAGVDTITDFNKNADRFDLGGGSFSKLSIAPNGDAMLTHNGGIIRIQNPPTLTLAQWNALVLPSGVSVPGGTPLPFGDDAAIYTHSLLEEIRAELLHLGHGDWAFA